MITDGRGSDGELDCNGVPINVVAGPDAPFGMTSREGFLVGGVVSL